MPQLNPFGLARKIAEAIAEGRLEAKNVPDMTDEKLAEFDKEAYQDLLDAQAENERLVADDGPTDKE